MSAIAMPYPTELRHDRLGFTFCLALALHAALILGISFNQMDRGSAASKIEITLAQHQQSDAPNKADFLAQSNQAGSGTLEEKAMLTSREQAEFFDNTIKEISQQQQQLMVNEQQAAPSAVIASNSPSQWRANAESEQKQTNKANQQLNDMTIAQRSQEIASLEARLDIQQQAFAKRPRIKRLTSVATQQADDALYLYNWRTKIESIGNKNYPSQARQKNIYGDLRLMVSLLPNGTVHQVKILQSSGHKVLDQAAIRIVHLAAPYAPFSNEMRKVDILEIIRTWRFQKNGLTSNS
jgi:protein TonB